MLFVFRLLTGAKFIFRFFKCRKRREGEVTDFGIREENNLVTLPPDTDTSCCSLAYMERFQPDLDMDSVASMLPFDDFSVLYIDAADFHPRNPFHFPDTLVESLFNATHYGPLSTVIKLVKEHPLLIEVRNKHGWTPLISSACHGQTKILQYLVETAKADVDISSSMTALHWSALIGKLEQVQCLLNGNANVEIKDISGNTALHYGCRYSKLEVVKLMIEKGKADTSVLNRKGQNLLHIAAHSNSNVQVMKFLVEECKLNVETKSGNSWTPLMLAANKGRGKVVKYLIEEAKCNIEAKDKSGKTALHFAARNGHRELVQFMVTEAKANVKAKTKCGYTLLHLAVQKDGVESLKLVKWLVNECNLTVDNRTNSKWTPLHWAARKGSTKVLKWLILEGHADVNALARKARYGRTALEFAKGNSDIVEFLVNAGADTSSFLCPTYPYSNTIFKFQQRRAIFMFLLGLHKRLGFDSSIYRCLTLSCIFEPALLPCIFEFMCV